MQTEKRKCHHTLAAYTMKISTSIKYYRLLFSVIFICLPNIINALQIQPALLNNTSATLEGQGSVITCIDDNPKPNSALVWTTGNRDIAFSNMRVTKISDSPPKMGLFINDISRENAGEYQCKSIDKITKQIYEAITLKLIVYKKTTFISPNVVNVKENETTEMECRIATDLDIKSISYTWKMNDQQIQNNTDRYKFYERNGYSELRIEQVNRNDTGVYQCDVYLVYDLAFTMSSQMITLNVEYKPEFASNIPKNIWIPGKQNRIAYQQTTSINITCMVNANPVAKIDWRRGSRGIRTTAEYIKEFNEDNLSTIMIKRPERRSATEEISYTCSASNRHGTARHEFIVKEGSLPAIPRLVDYSVNRKGLTLTVEESWTTPKLDVYRLDFGEMNVKFNASEGVKNELSVKNKTYYITLPNELKGEQSFKLFAHNPIGWSQPSQENIYTVYISSAMIMSNCLFLFLLTILLHIIH